MRLKPGVKVGGLQPEALLAAVVVESVLSRRGLELTLTSVRDSKHKPGSLHPKGYAFDFRTRDMVPSTRAKIVDEIRAALGADFDVLLESDHGHCEYDPKPQPS